MLAAAVYDVDTLARRSTKTAMSTASGIPGHLLSTAVVPLKSASGRNSNVPFRMASIRSHVDRVRSDRVRAWTATDASADPNYSHPHARANSMCPRRGNPSEAYGAGGR